MWQWANQELTQKSPPRPGRGGLFLWGRENPADLNKLDFVQFPGSGPLRPVRLGALGRTVWTGGLGKYRQFSFFHGEHKGIGRVAGQDANNINRRPRRGWMQRRLFQNDMQIRFVGLLVLIGDGYVDAVLCRGDDSYSVKSQLGLSLLLLVLNHRPHFFRGLFICG